MVASFVLGYRNSSTYPKGTLPGFGAPAALLGAHFEQPIVNPYEDKEQNSAT